MGSKLSQEQLEGDLSAVLQYHALTQQLMRHTSTHPGLPIEIVRDISRLSRLLVPMDELSTTKEINASARDQQPVRRLWFESSPFTSLHAIGRLATLRLSTHCHHQGWVSLPDQGSWSWFEVALLTVDAAEATQASGEQRVKHREDGTTLSWVSHRIPVDQKKPAHLEGSLFDTDHELFTHLEVGDAIGVFACAQFGAWSCRGIGGELALEMFFEPLPLIRP